MNENNIEMHHFSNNLLNNQEEFTNNRDADYANVRRHHRTTSMHRNLDTRSLPQSRTVPRDLEQRRVWMTYDKVKSEMEYHAEQIAERMERDNTLNQNNIRSDQLRKEALKSMPQFLTVKRHVKAKLSRSISLKEKQKGIAWYKHWKYNTSMQLSKAIAQVKGWISFFEIWYSTLKQIEGHFGSGIASYFKFFRWLFFLNFTIMIIVLIFIVLPQAIELNYEKRPKHAEAFSFQDIFTGEGYFTNTLLYYGFYSNDSLQVNDNFAYKIPYAYFTTMVISYGIYIILFGGQFASSYKKSFIETRSGLKNVFANKIFCAWDYTIATEEAATLKHLALFNELKELLSEDKKSNKVKFMVNVQIFFIRLTGTLLMFAAKAGIGYLIWYLLDNRSSSSGSTDALLTAIIINIVMIVFPLVLKFVSKYEGYKNPKYALYMNLIRLFILEIVIIGILIRFWTTKQTLQNCWETSLGQEVYRLIIFDFLFSVLFTLIFEVGRYFVNKFLWSKINYPMFEVAGHTIELVYNQTLFWVGFYFAPVLIIVVVIKLFIIWYVRSQSLLHFCKPSSKSWKAVEANTLFLILSLISALIAVSALGYIVLNTNSSDCGPLTNGIKGILPIDEDNVAWNIVKYIFKPGFITVIIITLCAFIYYQRAKAAIQIDVVEMFRKMLILEAKDKEYLLKEISKLTKGGWQYNLQDGRLDFYDPYKMRPSYKNKNSDPLPGDNRAKIL